MNRLAFIISLMALFGLTSCGSKPASTAVTCSTTASTSSTSTSVSTCTDPVKNISLTISPASVSVNVVAAQQFTGTLNGGTNNEIIWKVNNVPSGNPTVGLIDSSGLYHAPGQVPSTNPVSVTATSFEDQNLTATATVMIIPAPVLTITSPAPPFPVKVTAGAAAANQVTFSASETGGQASDVIYWCVSPVGGNAILGGDSTLGTINATGVYTPPLVPPIGSEVNVTAAISQDCQSSAVSVAVLISGFSTSSLGGQFAFSISGTNASGHFFRAGSFVADGEGNLKSGLEDINDSSGVATISFAGSYTMHSDGRGSMTFSDGRTPASFEFVVVNGSQLQIIGFDATGTATGQANAQVTTTFSEDALTGTYAFDFTGTHNSNAISEIGQFTGDGAGHITGGLIDINDNGATSQLQITGNTAPLSQTPVYPSTYSSPANTNGRGTLTLATSGATLHFSFYVVSRGSARFVGTDSQTAIGAFAGATEQESPNTTFDQSTLNGNYAFLLAGSGSGGSYATAGSFTADGQGNITSVTLDENLNGTPNPNVVLSGVSYTVAANGRGTLAFSGNRTFVFYLGPTGSAVLQETDANHPNIASDGLLARQQNTPFALTQIAGTYALYTSGLSGASAEVITGDLAPNSAAPGVISSGTVDVNAGGTTQSGVAITGGSYSTSSSPQRGTLALNLGSPVSQTRNYGIYVASPTQAFVLGIDSGRLAAGQLLRQF